MPARVGSPADSFRPLPAGDHDIQPRPERRLDGRVDFPPSRSVQAAASDVVGAATVSLVHLGTHMAVASTVTRPDGRFSLDLGGFTPEVDTPYLLEASKGLGGYRPGDPAPRFRTFVSWDGTRWRGIAEPTAAINALTTAVAIASGLDPDAVPPGSTFGKVNSGVQPPALNPTPVLGEGLDAAVVDLAVDIVAYLAGDVDPVAAIGRISPVIDSLGAGSGRAGEVVEIRGAGFSPLPGDAAAGGNTVRFGTAPASIVLATPIRLIVRVPAGAGGPNVTVQTARGTSAGRPFSVTGGSVAIEGLSPAQGGPGTTVTLFGAGFSATAAENAVHFGGGVTAVPTLADRDSLVVAVPAGARSGALTVSTPEGSSNPAFFTVPPQVLALFPDRGSKGQEVAITGSNFGSSAGAVTFAGATASVQFWSDERIMATVPAANSGPVAVVAGADAPAWDPGHGAVQRAAIVSPDGTLGAFSQCDGNGCSHLPVPFRFGTAAVIGDHVYLFFGHSTGWTNGIWRARILDADGNLGAFWPYTWSGTSAFHWPPVPLVFGSRVHVYGDLISGTYVTNGWDEFEIR